MDIKHDDSLEISKTKQTHAQGHISHYDDKYEFTKEDTRLYKIQIHIQIKQIYLTICNDIAQGCPGPLCRIGPPQRTIKGQFKILIGAKWKIQHLKISAAFKNALYACNIDNKKNDDNQIDKVSVDGKQHVNVEQLHRFKLSHFLFCPFRHLLGYVVLLTSPLRPVGSCRPADG